MSASVPVRVVEVAAFLPTAGTYSYAVPEGLELAAGARVWVPWRGRSVEGLVLGEGVSPPGVSLKAVSGRIDAPPVTAPLIALGRWMAEYYLAPLGEAMRLLVPPGGKAQESRRLSLTDEGRRTAAAIGQALEPESLSGLPLRERALLERLANAPAPELVTRLRREFDGAADALRELEHRGLVVSDRRVVVRQERMETWVRALSIADAGAPEPRPRGARRQALLAAVRAAGEASLSSLRLLDANARATVAALVAAGYVVTEERVADGDAVARAIVRDVPPTPTEDQAAALAVLGEALERGGYAPFLLHGATGSGKTEVYLRTIDSALARGRGALVLVPEIALTPQLAARFRARFGDEVAVLHSGLSDRERFEAWSRLDAGRVRIALGARSAVFAPVPKLGVVVIDEEHDGSFKQEEGAVRYHGRDVAMRRARDAGAVAVLGSATPSMESFEAARSGRITLLNLPGRPGMRPMPEVRLLDLRRFRPDEGMLSAPLGQAIEETLAAREQAILFLNRRGHSTLVLCTACGHKFRCKHCAVALTWHRARDRLGCHYCGYLEVTPSVCPNCSSASVERLGLGTERVEDHLRARFPTARIARLDRDTAQGKGLGAVLDGLRERTLDLVVGTQLVAKGHDFPGVTLVGVVLADQGLAMPDFRAAERTFQLVAQVAGRAGRGDRPGRVIVQTYKPDEPALVHAAAHDYLGFFDGERVSRQESGYPPLTRLGMVRIDGEDPGEVRRAAEAAARAGLAVAALAPPEAEVELLGPAEAPLSRLRGRTRWHLLVKARTPRGVRSIVQAALCVEAPRGVRLTVDVDPVSTL